MTLRAVLSFAEAMFDQIGDQVGDNLVESGWVAMDLDPVIADQLDPVTRLTHNRLRGGHTGLQMIIQIEPVPGATGLVGPHLA